MEISDAEEVVEDDLIYEQVYETEEDVLCSDQGSQDEDDIDDIDEDDEDDYGDDEDEYGSSESQDMENDSKLLSEEDQNQ